MASTIKVLGSGPFCGQVLYGEVIYFAGKGDHMRVVLVFDEPFKPIGTSSAGSRVGELLFTFHVESGASFHFFSHKDSHKDMANFFTSDMLRIDPGDLLKLHRHFE